MRLIHQLVDWLTQCQGQFQVCVHLEKHPRNMVRVQHQQDSIQMGDTNTNTQSLTSRGRRNTTLAVGPSRPPSRETHEHMLPLWKTTWMRLRRMSLGKRKYQTNDVWSNRERLRRADCDFFWWSICIAAIWELHWIMDTAVPQGICWSGKEEENSREIHKKQHWVLQRLRVEWRWCYKIQWVV